MPIARVLRLRGLLLNAIIGAMLGVLLAGPRAEAAVSVTLRNGLVSLEAQDAALGDVLGAIAGQARLDLRIKGKLDERVTWSIRYAPLEGAIHDWLLQKLLRGHSWVLTYRANGTGETMPVAEMFILGASSTEPAEQLVLSTPPEARATDMDDRIRDLKELIRHPDPSATAELAALAAGPEEPRLRILATVALGHLETPEAKAALVAASADDSDNIRKMAIKGLGEAWGDEAFEHLVRALQDDPAPPVRRQAILALTRIGSDRAMEFLRLAAEQDTDSSVRQAAERYIAILERKRAGQ